MEVVARVGTVASAVAVGEAVTRVGMVASVEPRAETEVRAVLLEVAWV